MRFKLGDFSIECDVAIEERSVEKINTLIEMLSNIVSSGAASSNAHTHYLFGNLYGAVSNIIGEDLSAWRVGVFPENCVQALNHFRQAYQFALEEDNYIYPEVATNLAGELSRQRRSIEAFELLDCNLSSDRDGPYVAALQKARELVWLSQWLNDPGHAWCYRYEAYLLFKELKENLTPNTHTFVRNMIESDCQIDRILQFGNAEFQDMEGWDKRSVNDESYDEEEEIYRQWCLKNRLFVNDLNDITVNSIADQDILQFPNYIVKALDGPFLSAAFSAIKREYCFARFLVFEALYVKHPEYETKRLFLTDTLDSVQYSGNVEKMKTAFRICFGVFDSIARLLSEYFDCESKHVAFTPRWIRENLSKHDNFFIDALFWLSCDLTDASSISADKWKAPNPASSEIRKMRNAMEHGWLRVSEEAASFWSCDKDFALTVTQQGLIDSTLSLLKLARSAMIYLCLAVSFHEKNNKHPMKLVQSVRVPIRGDGYI